MAADPSAGWWKLTFMRRRKSQPKVLYEIPGEYTPNSPSTTTTSNSTSFSTSSSSSSCPPVVASPPTPAASAVAAASGVQDAELNARLERIVDKSAASSKGRHVKVSHSGRFKEKRRPRAALARTTEGASGGGEGSGTRTYDENLSD